MRSTKRTSASLRKAIVYLVFHELNQERNQFLYATVQTDVAVTPTVSLVTGGEAKGGMVANTVCTLVVQ
jgi:hypothetical protein